MKYFNKVAFYQRGNKTKEPTDDGVSSGKWMQVDEETVTPQYSLPEVQIVGEHPIWSLPGYKGKQSKYRNFTTRDKDQIWQNQIKHNQAGVDYLKNIGKVGLTSLGAVAAPVAAMTAPLAFAGSIAGGTAVDNVTKKISGGQYNNFGEFAGDKLGIDPYFAGYLNPGAWIGGAAGSKVSTEAVGSAVRSISEGVKQAKEDVVNGARMVGDVLFPQAQPATIGITGNGRIQTLPGNYRTQNISIGKSTFDENGNLTSFKGIGTPKAKKPTSTEQPKAEQQPKAVNIVDRKGNKRDLDVQETYVQRGRDIYGVERGKPVYGVERGKTHYTVERGKDNYTVERGKDVYTPTKEGTKYFYDGVHKSSEVIPGQHVSTEINPVHTSTEINQVPSSIEINPARTHISTEINPTKTHISTEINPAKTHISTEINPGAVRNVTVPNEQTIKAGKYFDTKTGKPVTVVRTNTGTGKYNTTTGQYVQPNWFSRAWHNHPILTSLGTLGAATTTGTVIIPGIVGAVSGKGAKHSISDATEKVGEVGDKAWNGSEEVEQRQRVQDSIQNAEQKRKQDSIDFNNGFNATMDSLEAELQKKAQAALQQKQQ